MATAETPTEAGYRALARLPGVRPLLFAFLLSRTAVEGMVFVTLVLTCLRYFNSPALAGAVAFLAIAPGQLASPVAGALLDRFGRLTFIIIDAAIAATVVAALAVTTALGPPPTAALLVAAFMLSLTRPLAQSGERALLPTMVPRHLWDAVNAIDNVTYTTGALVGPPFATLLFAVIAPAAAFAACSIFLLCAAALLTRVHDPHQPSAISGNLGHDIAEGAGYFFRHRVLLRVAGSAILVNISAGAVVILLPVFVVSDLGLQTWVVGLLFALDAITATMSFLVIGRIGTEGHESALMAFGALLTAAGGVAFIGHSIAGLVVAMLLFGASSGPFWVPLYSIRQRATAPLYFARALAISASLNYSGQPIGSLVTGQLLGHGWEAAAVGAAIVAPLVGAVVASRITAAFGRD